MPNYELEILIAGFSWMQNKNINSISLPTLRISHVYIYFHLLWKNNKLIYLKLKLKFNLFSTWWVDNHEMWHSTHISQQILEINKYIILSTYPIGFWKEPVIHLKRRQSKVAVSLKKFTGISTKKKLTLCFPSILALQAVLVAWPMSQQYQFLEQQCLCLPPYQSIVYTYWK